MQLFYFDEELDEYCEIDRLGAWDELVGTADVSELATKLVHIENQLTIRRSLTILGYACPICGRYWITSNPTTGWAQVKTHCATEHSGQIAICAQDILAVTDINIERLRYIQEAQ
jgi:hypothetical protein